MSDFRPITDEELQKIRRQKLQDQTLGGGLAPPPEEAPVRLGSGLDVPETTGPSAVSQRYQVSADGVDVDDLYLDANMAQAGRIMFNMNKGKDDIRVISDKEAVDYAVDQMGWFNNNMTRMAYDTALIAKASDEEREAFLYAMEAYDDLNMSWDGTWRFVRGNITDPINLTSLGTFGFSFLGKTAAQAATKEGVKFAFKGATKNAAIGAIDGSIFAATDNTLRQVVETSVTGEDIDMGEAAKSSLFGAAFGGVVGGAATPVINKIQRAAGTTKGNKSNKVSETTGEVTEEVSEELKDGFQSLEVKALDTSTPEGKALTGMKKIEAALKKVTKDGMVGVIDGRQVQEVVQEALGDLTSAIGDVETRDLDSVVIAIKRMALTQAEHNAMGSAVQGQVSKVKAALGATIENAYAATDDTVQSRLFKERDELEKLAATLEALDAGFASTNGRSLKLRQMFINRGKLKDVLPETLRKDSNLTQEEADMAFVELVKKQQKALTDDNEIKALTAEMHKAIESNDIEKAHDLLLTRKLRVKQQLRENSHNSVTYGMNRVINLANEVAISFVFTTSTLTVNTIPSILKTMYKPLVNFVVSDWDSAAGRQLWATYRGMYEMSGAAAKAALAAYRYERSMLTGDYSKFLEGGNIIPKEFAGSVPLGSVIRVFPSLVNATDEFFSQINYRGYVQGMAEAEGYRIAKTKKRLKTKEQIDAFVKKHVDETVVNSYDRVEQNDMVQALMEQALDRGMNPEQTKRFVAKEIEKNSAVFNMAKDKVGRSYVDDLLFKRKFSKKSGVSNLAAEYESLVKKAPVMRLMGQLFFRTPVRVFEEGLRLTAGVQFLTPNFIADLRGKNGPARQIRAQGEAMLSYSIAGLFAAKYAQGEITGSVNQDYKIRRMHEDTDRAEPYTVKLSDGSTFGFRNFDPISTPFKIMANAMEAVEMLEYRIKQGERVDDTEFERTFAYFNSGAMALTQAIRDASLVEGIDQSLDLALSIGKPEFFDEFVKFTSSKTALFFPNMAYKTRQQFEPELTQPKMWDQFLYQRSGLSMGGLLRPPARQYNVLGMPRKLNNPSSVLLGISITSDEERKKGMDDKTVFVLRKLEEIAIATNASFYIPHKIQDFGPQDLRTAYMPDGSETVYDRLNQHMYADGALVESLYPILMGNLPVGVASVDGAGTAMVKKIMRKYLDVAKIKTMAEISPNFQPLINQKRTKAEKKMGLFDVNTLPIKN